MILANVDSVVIHFAPSSHAHGAIAPAVFEIKFGLDMDALELVILRLQKPRSLSDAVQLCLQAFMTVLPIADFDVTGSLRSPEPPYFANQRGTLFKLK